MRFQENMSFIYGLIDELCEYNNYLCAQDVQGLNGHYLIPKKWHFE